MTENFLMTYDQGTASVEITGPFDTTTLAAQAGCKWEDGTIMASWQVFDKPVEIMIAPAVGPTFRVVVDYAGQEKHGLFWLLTFRTDTGMIRLHAYDSPEAVRRAGSGWQAANEDNPCWALLNGILSVRLLQPCGVVS